MYRIGVAEKGSLAIELRVESSGGHASMPPRENSIGILANAVAKYVFILSIYVQYICSQYVGLTATYQSQKMMF